LVSFSSESTNRSRSEFWRSFFSGAMACATASLAPSAKFSVLMRKGK
jgi:hypothetical protein